MEKSMMEMKMKQRFERCDQRLFSGKVCGAQFDSPIALMKHLKVVHKIPECYSPLVAAVVDLKGPAYASLDGEHVFMKLAPYQKDRFCILHVVEYKFWVRAWVTEADPSVDPRHVVPIKITVPTPDFERNTQPDYLYQFTGRILPFGTYSFKSEAPMQYFDVPKSFLKQYYEKRADGLFGVGILFAIGRFNAKGVFKEDSGVYEKKSVVLRVDQEEVEEGVSGRGHEQKGAARGFQEEKGAARGGQEQKSVARGGREEEGTTGGGREEEGTTGGGQEEDGATGGRQEGVAAGEGQEEEDGGEGQVETQAETEPVTANASGGGVVEVEVELGAEDDDDEIEIVRPFCEIYD